MKKLFSFLGIVAIVLASNCSRIPENNDDVIGIWSDEEINVSSPTAKQETVRHEWIFNDAYLGRYHRKTNGAITFKTDFKWSIEDDTYTITYLGTDMPVEHVHMQSTNGVTILADNQGQTMATRE
ncbi:hypothetical protein [Cytophaga sp. FL35]|uniref:hypothetical protein n=1 Tax=Cytophaga sp. FL35 TaxID=1904456 RepID=UPI001653A729|nr:hypothetical protein [Cytophaga sp. FL35]MBC6998179.1 hypothetical protein [Cytophaga sp. FL35]